MLIVRASTGMPSRNRNCLGRAPPARLPLPPATMMTPVRSIGLSFYCLSGACTVAGRTSESSCVICSSGLTSPLSSAVMWSRTNSNSARFSLAIGSAGSDGIFSGSIGVPFFQTR